MKKLLSTLRIATALVLSVFSSGVLPVATAFAADNNGRGPDSSPVVETTQSISAKALTSHECNDSEWHFVITNIDTEADAPSSITVNFANSDTVTVPLGDYTGKTAHYTTTADLTSTVTSATATIYAGWTGEFNLSHGPCGEVPPTPAQPTVLASATACSDAEDSNGSATVTVTNVADGTGASVVYTVAVSGAASQTVTLDDGAQSTLTFNGLSAGSHTVTVTGDDDTTASTTVTIAECETPPTPETPAVNVDVLPCTENTNSTDAVKVTVTNTADATNDAVVYTATVKNASTDTTVTSYTFASLADGASANHTFNGLPAGDYYVVISGNDQTTATSDTFTVNECHKETPPPCQYNCGGEEDRKVFVCKYVGTPGIDERLQTGQNPISVSVNSLKNFTGLGSFFNDAQGRSYAIAYDIGQPEPSADQCPGNERPQVQVIVPCVEKGHTTDVTIRVTNKNDFSVTYKVVVEQPDGTGTNELMATIPAGDSHDFTFNGYGVGTFDFTVYEGTQSVSTFVPTNMPLDMPGAFVPSVPQYTWKEVFSHNFTIAECQPEHPPVDVCLNIPGVQTEVPSGYVKDGDNCARVLGTTDVCPNIEGTQTTVPAGMTKDTNGNCVTPVTPTTPAGGAGAGQVLGEALPTELPATGGTNLPNPLLSIVAGFLTYLFLQRRNTRKAEA